ncbi:energy transducer TonB [Aliikangiella coralliicola]|uniref:Energy transducer TonB n=1 Tax=Aliikangiella coralliicola TaxID=2592383 RepID=A0A545UHT7_9GAMM|nr:energy transducer TonB [Aliikangiella coralliicola]TQV89018.1 energy transducer TonB [Aliikangiella coralliicola]
MQNYEGTIDSQDHPKISQSDKLLFCAFLALAFHALVFFGVGFKLPELSDSKYEKTFNVILAQFEAEKKPETADFIGQANQEGGGESEEKLMPSTTEMAQFNDPDKIANEPQQMRASSANSQPTPEIINSLGELSAAHNPQENSEKSQQQVPDAAALIDKSYQLSGLIANLDNRDINQARKGRRRAISASVHRSSDALYLDSWRRKIEQVGNQNYPQKAKINKVYGNLTLKVAINRDGTINQLSIMKSSGEKILDNAALRIVRLAAPFRPLTKEMTKDTDILEIIRVWQFQPDYKLRTN